MGLRSSKYSYDIDPIVSNSDFKYTRTSRPLPEVVLPSSSYNGYKEEEHKNEIRQETNGSVKSIKTDTPTSNGKAVIANGLTVEIETSATFNADIQKVQETSVSSQGKRSNGELSTAEIHIHAPLQDSTSNGESLRTKLHLPVPLRDSTSNEEPSSTKSDIPVPLQDSIIKEEPSLTESQNIPAWVNEENFKIVIEKSYPTYKEIISFKANPALAAGENYATLMLRVEILIRLQDDSTKDLAFMLKVAHDTKEMMEMLQHSNFFNTENSVYNDVIPEMEEMYRKAGVTIEIAPKSYRLGGNAPAEYYVLLDDLSVRGFKNANRLECLDMEHTLAVLKKLAQFHAASACRVAVKGNYGEIFAPAMDNDMVRAMIGQMFGGFKKPFMENLPTYENGEKYLEKMDKFFDHLVDVFIKVRKIQPENFNVLNHGDSWSNNILFNYTSDGKLDDVLFVDYQNTHYSSVAQDLFYFLISSVRIDFKTEKFDYFIHFYHQHLEENLKLLEYPHDILTLRELHMQLIDMGTWATLTSFLTMGIVLLDPTDSAKFENFMSESKEGMEFKQKIFSNPRYIKYANELLPWLHNRGFMDVDDSDIDIVLSDKTEEVTISATSESQPSKFDFPEWVNESYFYDIVRSDYEHYHGILKFAVSPATNAGDNYSSIMLKVEMEVELMDKSFHNISYMLKIPPAGKEAKTVIEFLGSFEKEITAYNQILPQFEMAYKSQAGLDIVFGPKSYKLPRNTEKDTLILENLKCQGFTNCDRLEGLDMEHTKAVLKKLAEFHAASAYVFQTEGKYPEVYEKSIYTEEYRKERGTNVKEFFDIYYNCVKEFSNTEEYLHNLKYYLDNIFDYMAQTHTVDDTKFNVLNHGDCWTNNIMFQYDDKGQISNTYFVDFQLMKYGSPAYDLYYLLFTSTKFKLKLEQFEYFIRYYHENLQRCLELLKYPKDIPTLKELHMELLDQSGWALYAAVTPMAVILLDPTDNASLELMMKSDESGVAFKKKIFSHQRYRLHAEAVFSWMSKRGLLDMRMLS